MDRRARFRKIEKNRRLFQVGSTLLGNSYLKGFFEGSIYQGRLKTLCLPGLNCYSCPGAIGSCPLGALQNSIADPFQQISFYIIYAGRVNTQDNACLYQTFSIFQFRTVAMLKN